MTSVVLVAARAANGVIGLHGDIPWKIPADFAHFKRVTVGHPLVLGRTTFEGIGKPLPDRQSIVVTRDPAWSYDGVLVARSVDEAVRIGAGLDDMVMVGGGAQVYRDALPMATDQILTEVHADARRRHLLPRLRRVGLARDPARGAPRQRSAVRGPLAGAHFLTPRLGVMDLRIFTEPQQGATYDQLLRIAQASEDLGFGAFFRSDHYLGMGTEGRPGPTDAWTTLAGLARETSTIRLGTLMTSVTFRHPGPLAIQVAQVDQMSGGRVEFGIGAGWYEAEHAAYGIPFPDTRQRFDILAEQLAVITGLWETGEGELFSHAGEHYTLTDSPALPKPAQRPRPPVLVGGKGKRRTPALAAEFADEFNLPFVSLEVTSAQFGRVRKACEDIGRDPDELTYSNALVLCCGATEADVRRRADAIGRDADDLRATALAGTPAEVVDRIGQFAELGSERVYLQTLDLDDLDHIELVANEVVPQL